MWAWCAVASQDACKAGRHRIVETSHSAKDPSIGHFRLFKTCEALAWSQDENTLTISQTHPCLFKACLSPLSRCCCRGEYSRRRMRFFSVQGIVCPATFRVAFGVRVVLVQKVVSRPVSMPAAKKPSMHSLTISSRFCVLDANRQMSSA